MRIRRDSKPYKILKYLMIAGGVLVLSSVSPLGGAQLVRGFIKEYFRKKRFERGKFLRDLKHLQTRELIDYRELPDGKVRLVLTKLGKKKMLVYDLDEIKLNTSKGWDGLWRMVIFDIPHHQKKARDAFRQKLKILGLYPIQKSVFLTPYKCDDEVDFICSVFDIRRYVLIFHIKHFEGSEKFKHYFKV